METQQQNLQDKTKAIARGKLKALMYILENKNHIKPMTSAHLMKLVNKEQITFRINKRKGKNQYTK